MSDYQPIDCDYYDEIESWSIAKAVCDIEYTDAVGQAAFVTSRIADVFARDGAEFLRIDTGELIRLDRLLSINGKQLPKAC